MDISIPTEITDLAKITVFGVGGAGGNALQHMINNGLSDVTFVCANTDAQALNRSSAENKIQLGPQLTKGLGAGAKPEIGQKAAEESMQEIAKFLQDTDMVFITAGMGGGTGTGAAPIIAKMAKEKGILTIGVVTKPFTTFEGKRIHVANKGIEELRQYVDCLIAIPNDRLRAIAPKKASAKEMFMKANDVLLSAVRGVTEVITKPGFINVDFADLTSVMTKKGAAIMGEGSARGENRAIDAVKQAISSPLLEDVNIFGAQALLINITGEMTMEEFDQIGEYLNAAAVADSGELPDVFYGMVEETDDSEELHITIIATGLTPENNELTAPNTEKTSTVIPFQQAVKTEETAQNMEEKQNIVRKPYFTADEYTSTLTRNRHTPGAMEFTFDNETDDIPAFIRRQAN